MKISTWAALGGLAVAMAATPAAAITHTVSLSGDLATATTASFDFPPDQITQTYLTLTGFTPFTIMSGDQIDFSISFTGIMFGDPAKTGYTVSPSVSGPFGQTFLVFFEGISGTSPPGAAATPVSALTLGGASGDLAGLALSVPCPTCLGARAGRASGSAYGSFMFDTLAGSINVAVDDPYEITGIRLLAQVGSANDIGVVPEPASWAMLIAGFGLVGAAMRRNARPIGRFNMKDA
jgi:hypothetical protein